MDAKDITNIIKNIKNIIENHSYQANTLITRDKSSKRNDRLCIYFEDNNGTDEILESIRNMEGIKSCSHICTNNSSFGYKAYIQIGVKEEQNINLSLLKITERSKKSLLLKPAEIDRLNKGVYIIPIYCAISIDDEGNIEYIKQPSLQYLKDNNIRDI